MDTASHRPVPSGEPAVIGELFAVSKVYRTEAGREQRVLDQIDLTVREGEMLALLGQSGSGKSTILRCLTGLVQPSTGQVLCYGKPLEKDTINPHASIVFQTFALYPWLTVAQNVGVGLMSKRLSRTERKEAIARVIEVVGLKHYHRSYPRELSGGMRQRVGLARALVSEPKLLCLDEPAAGFNPSEKSALMDLIRKIRDDGYTVLLIEHDMRLVMGVTDRIVVLEFGRKIAEGLPAEIRDNPAVIAAYLGVPDDATA